MRIVTKARILPLPRASDNDEKLATVHSEPERGHAMRRSINTSMKQARRRFASPGMRI